jgi:hypothetical protein
MPQLEPAVQVSLRPVTLSVTGILRRLSEKPLIVEPDDHRIVWFRLADDFRREGAGGFAPGNIRSTSVCVRNQTSFRNYVKFDAESEITFEK